MSMKTIGRGVEEVEPDIRHLKLEEVVEKDWIIGVPRGVEICYLRRATRVALRRTVPIIGAPRNPMENVVIVQD